MVGEGDGDEQKKDHHQLLQTFQTTEGHGKVLPGSTVASLGFDKCFDRNCRLLLDISCNKQICFSKSPSQHVSRL